MTETADGPSIVNLERRLHVLSSPSTLIVKFILAPLWIVISGLIVRAITTSRVLVGSGPPFRVEWLFLLIWLIGTAGILRFTIPLKRVELRDGRLTVSNFRRDWEIPAGEVAEVRQNRWANGRPIRVRLRREIEGLGSSFTFMPSARWQLDFWRESPEVGQLRAWADSSGAIALSPRS